MEENKEKKENKIKFSEKASLFFRRKWLVDGTKTFSKVALFLEDKFSLIEPAISSARLSGSK